MTAGDVSLANARPVIATTRRHVLRIAAPILSLGLAWWLSAVALPPLVMAGLVVYAVIHVVLIVQRRRAGEKSRYVIQNSIVWLAVGVDMLFGILLLSQASQLQAAIHPLFLVLIIRALSSYRRLPLALVVPFMFGLV